MLAPSGFGPAHVILVVFATLGESQATDIAQLNFRSGSKSLFENDSVIGSVDVDDGAVAAMGERNVA
jgi:hypothetical protein